MKRSTNLLTLSILLIVIAFITNSCKTDDQSRIQASWSSKDPILIPQNVRLNELNMGNLVFNNSFESGKVYYKESNVKSFDIDGWKKIGENIEWVNSELENYSKKDVADGIHSVKITRTTLNETEELGDGILSNFIKVIPGNYNLNLLVKLKDIKPNRQRIGSKMSDAINIKIFFYDKNKIEINASECNPFLKGRIDNSLKSLSFAHFKEIENMEWNELIGSTAYFPFFDGDIPDNARYAKIFIGLKGTGTMWVDDIEFNYTKQNFTQLERIKTYFDSSFNQLDFLYPEPKMADRKKQIAIYDTVNNKLPLIIIPNKPNKIHHVEAQRIKQFLLKNISGLNTKIHKDDIKIVQSKSNEQIDSNQFVISLGSTILYDKNSALLNDSLFQKYKQSYLIESTKEQPNLVYLKGNTKHELKFAVNTFMQMIDGTNYHAANVFDYPDIELRNYLIHGFDGKAEMLESKIDLLEFYKYSYPYFEIYNDNELFYNEFDINKFIQTNTAGIFLNANRTDLDQLEAYQKDYKILLKENDSTCTNVALNYINSNNETREFEYLSSYSNLKDIHCNEIEAAILYKDITDDIDLAWTGPVEFSVSIDDINMKQIEETYKQIPILFDNSLLSDHFQLKTEYIKQYYAGKLRVKSIVEAFDFNITENAIKKHNKVLVNTLDILDLSTIRLLTAINYYWNTDNYDPDKTLWIVLNKLYGRENAINILRFNDSYYGLIEICEKMKSNGSHFKALRMAKKFENDLNKYWDLLVQGNLDKDLLNELFDLKEVIEFEYNKILSENS